MVQNISKILRNESALISKIDLSWKQAYKQNKEKSKRGYDKGAIETKFRRLRKDGWSERIVRRKFKNHLLDTAWAAWIFRVIVALFQCQRKTCIMTKYAVTSLYFSDTEVLGKR